MAVKKQKKQNKECPLCKVSEETLKKLKKKSQDKESQEKPVKKKISWRLKIGFLIFVFTAAGFTFYQFSLAPPQRLTEEENLGQEQPQEKNKGSILDIFPKSLEVGDLAPDFISEDVYGNKISLNDFRDKKPVLLVFWATWCGYCRKEIPGLKAFTDKYQDEIQVIAVSSGESREAIKDHIQEYNINFLMLLDEDRKIWNQYFVRGTPSHFLIDKQGKIVTLRPGLASKEDLEIMTTMLTELW